MKRIKHLGRLLVLTIVSISVSLPRGLNAQASIDFPSDFAELSNQDLKETITNIVRIVLGFLGLLTVIFIIYGGFIWMTSYGNPDRISTAKKLISAAVVGLILILVSYSIATFVVGNIANAV